MKKSAAYTLVTVCCLVAAVLWFLMFSPWMGLQDGFWLMMCGSSLILLGLSIMFGNIRLKFDLQQVLLGCALAVVLWGVFWVGDKLSQLMFGFARGQVDTIYALGDGSRLWLVGLQLLFITGPAEEIFWRGFIQKKLSDLFSQSCNGTILGRSTGSFVAMCITLAVYTLIHIWSFNFMLIMAALVAGFIWGALYWYKPEWLPALVLSHALWDAAVFAVFPI